MHDLISLLPTREPIELAPSPLGRPSRDYPGHAERMRAHAERVRRDDPDMEHELFDDLFEAWWSAWCDRWITRAMRRGEA